MTTSTAPATGTYSIDAAHSHVEFSVRHLMISKVRGRFSQVSGSIALTQSEVPSAVEAAVGAASIDTREAQRDAHLKSADFFDVERYPELRFTSTSVQGNAEGFSVTGNLTIHGVTRPVTLQAELEGSGRDPWGGERVAYSARTTINRKDFGLAWNQALETGGVVVGDEVKIELNVEAVLQK